MVKSTKSTKSTKSSKTPIGHEIYLILSYNTHGDYVVRECRSFREAVRFFRDHSDFLGTSLRIAKVIIDYGEAI